MRTLTLLFCLTISVATYAQLKNTEFGLGYTYAAPLATMKQNIRQGHGFTMNYYFIPEKNKRFAFGIDASYTIYGYDKSKQRYEFDDGSTARMDIIVNNSFVNVMAGVRYLLVPGTEKSIQPYVSLKAGYSWFRTNLNIYDPDDNDHCEPVDTDMLLQDGTFIVSPGAGFYWDLSTIFKKKEPNRFFFNVAASLTLGGRVRYMNTDAPTLNQDTHENIHAQFVNTQTQIVHEHHVGYVYSSYVEMIEIRGGFVYRLVRDY
jgi:hypothetical protein